MFELRLPLYRTLSVQLNIPNNRTPLDRQSTVPPFDPDIQLILPLWVSSNADRHLLIHIQRCQIPVVEPQNHLRFSDLRPQY